MNKKIIFVIGVIMIIVAVTVILISNNNNNNLIEKPNNDFSGDSNIAAEGMEPINTTIKLEDLLKQVKDDKINKLVAVEDSKANELLNLRNYVGLEKMVAQHISDNEFTEIWLFKISEESQSLDLFRLFNNRIENLRGEYKDNEAISSIIKNEKNIVIKQQNGIVIMIISNDAENIESIIDEKF